MRISQRIRPWMLVSAAWIVPAILAAVNRLAQGRLSDWGPASLRELLFASGDWFLYAFLTPAVFAISKRWPFARPHLARRAALHLGFALLFCAAWALGGMLLRGLLAFALKPGALDAALRAAGDQALQQVAIRTVSWMFITLPFGVAVYLCMVGMEHAMRYFVEARDRETQMVRLSEQLTGARLAALQAQLNPHFLFNSLNTVTVLVRDGDSAAATRVIEQLSDVLRRTLNRSGENEVAFDDELDLVRQYLAVEQARFSDRLRPEFHIDPSVRAAAIPSFALQHLVENAIRHGIARRTDAGRVIVTARRDGDMLDIAVEDDGAGVQPGAAAPNGRGLDNTRERLRTLYGERASLLVAPATPPSSGTVARLRIPWREIVLERASEEPRA